jgi:hypothetical protein
MCVVPNLVGLDTSAVPAAWTGAGFFGDVTYVPNNQDFTVVWQSLDPGTDQACSSGIRVRRTLP